MKRAQVTLFIIIAIVLVLGVLAIILLSIKNTSVISKFKPTENPRHFIALCAEEAVQEAIAIAMPRGGFIEPKLFTEYGGEKIGYLCYVGEYNEKCKTLVPLYLNHLGEEIKNYVSPKIDSCFEDLEDEFQSKGLFVDLDSEMVLDLRIIPKIVGLEITRSFSFKNEGGSQSVSEFEVYVESNLYEISKTIEKIVSHEAKFCSFENSDYMLFYPDIKITKKGGRDNAKIYKVYDSKSLLEANFAIRGCVWDLV